MLQEVAKTIKTSMNGSFIKRLSQYLHDCVREEVKSSTFRNLKGDKDNKWMFLEGEEKAFTKFDSPILLESSPLLTELMIQSEMDTKDKYLLYGFLFLKGKNTKAKKNNDFLTPLLYAPCKLERKGVNILLTIQEELLSLNTGALAQLIKRDDEEEVDTMISGLLDVVPDLPLTQEALDVFIVTLKSLIGDDIEVVKEVPTSKDFYGSGEDAGDDLIDELADFDFIDEIKKTKSVKVEKLYLEYSQAVILTKRPQMTAGVLHELTQIGEKSAGILRENALNAINQEYLISKGKAPFKETINPKQKPFYPITSLSLSDSQEEVIKKIEENNFLAVYGPPGTGKSQTIVNLVTHLIATGKTVLVASRMDKAIDVVADRLNSLNAPYLALRAGRANYQKQLNFQLQDLLSGKVDLNTDYEDAVLVDVSDMETLMNEINLVEEKIEKVIKLEEKYTEVQLEKADFVSTTGEFKFIKSSLNLSQVNEAKKIINYFENKKTNLFTGFLKFKNLLNLKKLLNNKNIQEADFVRISCELDVAEIDARALDIEENIYKIGNLQQLMNKLQNLKNKKKRLAVDILRNKRRNALKELLSDQKKRQRLLVHAKSLVSKRSLLQSRLLENEDFKPLLETFPCWCTTTYAVSNSIPLKSAMFDVVIIDEASQCDIASCFPLLYRAKKAVIVGDEKQLPHLSFLEKAKEQSFLNQYGIEDKYQLMWRFRTNSMFDLANYYSVSPVLLDEHFRSMKPIIEFSSREFYGGRIKIMKPYFNEEKTVDVIEVLEGKVDFDATRNFPEAEAVMQKVRDLISAPSDKPISIGIISPFRAQVDLIKKDIMREFPLEIIQKHKIEVGTAHTFQGDERDVMLISWTYAPNSHSQSLMFLQKPNLFNVAITRARHQTINFVSKPVRELPEGLLRDYLEYVAYQNHDNVIKNTFKNDFEKDVFETLSELVSDKIYAGVETGGVNADIMINNIVIECDGAIDEIKDKVRCTKKQAILERCGFKVLRVTKREWDLSRNSCVERIKAYV